jgi:CRP/FNR family transcriptional regulator, cyclic AMP receptor protein
LARVGEEPGEDAATITNGPARCQGTVDCGFVARRDVLLEYYQRVPLFSACTKKDLKLVAAQSERVRVKAGQVLIHQGETGREFFAIVEGTARVIRNGRKIARLGPGEAFGELALLDRAPRNATVVAESDMELLVLGQREFAKIVDATPGFAHALLMGVARRIHDSDERDLS